MNRITVSQSCIDHLKGKVYLEIGVATGTSFRQIHAEQKIAVDPAFNMSAKTRLAAESGAKAVHYFEKPSDDFFRDEAEWLKNIGIDVAFIDGLHTYGQTLRDVNNALNFLREEGIIVMHDCNPPLKYLAFPAESYADLQERHPWWRFVGWQGDTWKAIVDLRSTRPDLLTAVLNCDGGVGIVRRGKPDSMLELTPAEIAALDYDDLKADRVHFLNLRPVSYLTDFLNRTN